MELAPKRAKTTLTLSLSLNIFNSHKISSGYVYCNIPRLYVEIIPHQDTSSLLTQ